ncbi:hypothetical protein ACHAXT_012472, partial [Thalassiosira profunda]
MPSSTAFRPLAALALVLATGPRGASAAHECYDEEPPTCGATHPCFDDKSCCMQTNYAIYGGTNSLGCTANSLSFHEVTGFTVYDEQAWNCNCDCEEGAGTCQTCDALGGEALPCEGKPMGTVFDACQGIDDYVEVSFEIGLQVKGEQYDVGLYIASDGGNAVSGDQCIISGLTLEDPDTSDPWENIAGDQVVGVADKEAPGDECWDFLGAGYLFDYPFSRVILKCYDSPVDEPSAIANDGLLDFSVAASFFQNTGDACSYDGPIYLPMARGEIDLTSSIGKTRWGRYTIPAANFNPPPNALVPSQVRDAKDIFQTAIVDYLTSQTILPAPGVSVVVTGISDNEASEWGTATEAYVDFDIREFGGDDTMVVAIENALAAAGAQTVIESAVIAAAAGTSVQTSLSTTDITAYTDETTNVNGKTPPYEMTSAETREMKAFIADAIYDYLDAGIALPSEVVIDGNTHPRVEVSHFDLVNTKAVYVVRLDPTATQTTGQADVDTINTRLAHSDTESNITAAVLANNATSLNPDLVNALGAAISDLPATIYDRSFHYPPFPGTSSKCWAGQRITLPINVPNFTMPSSAPSISAAPSNMPSTSANPTSQPSISSAPSNVPSTSASPSNLPSISSAPSNMPSISAVPIMQPSISPSVSTEPSSSPTSQPSTSAKPSSLPSESPSISSMPSESPSHMPSTSAAPSSQPSASPSTSTAPSLS